MKTTRTFKGSWFLGAVVATIAIGEFVAWKIGEINGHHLSPVTVAFVCAGLVAAAASVIFDGADLG